LWITLEHIQKRLVARAKSIFEYSLEVAYRLVVVQRENQTDLRHIGPSSEKRRQFSNGISRFRDDSFPDKLLRFRNGDASDIERDPIGSDPEPLVTARGTLASGAGTISAARPKWWLSATPLEPEHSVERRRRRRRRQIAAPSELHPVWSHG